MPRKLPVPISLDEDVDAEGRIRLGIVAPNGRRVRTLGASNLDAGEHSLTWNRRSADGARLPSGLYLLRLKVNGQVATGKVIVMD